MISAQWLNMAWIFALSICMVALVQWRLPPSGVLALCTAATALALCVPAFRRIERGGERSLLFRATTMLLAVALPMALYGLAIAQWAMAGGLEWYLALGALILCTSLSSVVQSGMVPGLFAAQFACWGAVALSDGSIRSVGLLIGTVLIAIFAAYRNAHLARLQRERHQERERVRNRAEEILNDYEDTGQGWFWETDGQGILTYLSHTVSRLVGCTEPDEMVGRPLTDLFDFSAGGNEGERALNFHITARSSFQELAVRAAIPGEERWWSISGRPIQDDYGDFMGFRGSGFDLTEKKRSEEKASRLAHYDSLTGLANRFQMSQSLKKILSASDEGNRCCAVMLLDLDRFKQVNDTLGHPAGDALLKQISRRLEHAVGDMGRVGRLGGDEFEVIVPGQADRERLATLAREIIEALSKPYSIEGHRVVIGASVGISIAPDNGVTGEALIRNADLALYAAKDGGRGRYHFYAPSLHSQAEERRHLEQDLRDAIARGGLELAYQPVVNTVTEQITGFEALLRWNHPTRGMMPPQRFVEIAEEAGLIGPIGEWALRTACHDLARWPKNVRVAVNVSPLQFANPHLPAIVTSALAEAGVDASRLELEITESVFLTDDDGTDAMFAALKGVGVRLALDDFGTGYSSLGYLKKAPFDKIKIDQSFVRGATQPGSRNAAIIASITSLAQALGMETTAEGVETLDELDLVRMHGCSHVQGFIYEMPLTAEAAAERLRTGLAAVARGPRAPRAARHMMLRKVVLEHDGQLYNGTIRNVSATGALIEGLWNVPPGAVFHVRLSASHTVIATCRWCEDNRMGVEFAVPLRRDGSGRFVTERGSAERPKKPHLRKAG